MIVYHGSTETITKPDINHSFRNLDFEKGFYVTSVREQAERWAKRKTLFDKGSIPVVSEFEYDGDTSFLVKDFGNDYSEWIDFVSNCRDGQSDYLKYDIIIGKVADDKVYRVVDMYRKGIWD